MKILFARLVNMSSFPRYRRTVDRTAGKIEPRINGIVVWRLVCLVILLLLALPPTLGLASERGTVQQPSASDAGKPLGRAQVYGNMDEAMRSYSEAFAQKDEARMSTMQTRLCDTALKVVVLPKEDMAPETERGSLTNCKSDVLYYGLDGKKPDSVRARWCAYQEEANDDGSSGVFNGSDVLLMIYANGDGIKRNWPLAFRFACQVDGAPAELSGRIRHIEAMRQQPQGMDCDQANPAGCRLDICDDITSGYMQGRCALETSDRNETPLKAKEDAMVASWPAEHRAAYQSLREKSQAYIEAHSQSEVDLSGTGRAAFVTEHEVFYLAEFRADIAAAENRALPGREADFVATDKELNAVYKELMSGRRNTNDLGTVTLDDIKATQRKWLAYRDAFVAFARIHYPSLPADAVKARLTRERIRTLQAIPSIDPSDDGTQNPG